MLFKKVNAQRNYSYGTENIFDLLQTMSMNALKVRLGHTGLAIFF